MPSAVWPPRVDGEREEEEEECGSVERSDDTRRVGEWEDRKKLLGDEALEEERSWGLRLEWEDSRVCIVVSMGCVCKNIGNV